MRLGSPPGHSRPGPRIAGEMLGQRWRGAIRRETGRHAEQALALIEAARRISGVRSELGLRPPMSLLVGATRDCILCSLVAGASCRVGGGGARIVDEGRRRTLSFMGHSSPANRGHAFDRSPRRTLRLCSASGRDDLSPASCLASHAPGTSRWRIGSAPTAVKPPEKPSCGRRSRFQAVFHCHVARDPSLRGRSGAAGGVGAAARRSDRRNRRAAQDKWGAK